MKTKLQRTLLLGAFALMGMQVAQAQYFGTPFGGVAAKIGTGAVGTVDKIEIENFDSMPGFVDGFNVGTNFGASAFGTYWDKSTLASGAPVSNNAGGDVSGTYRSTGDVDIAEIVYEDTSVGYVTTGNQGSEYTMQTVEVVTAGTYHLNLNFRSFGANKRFQITLYDIATQTAVKTLFNATSADAPDGRLLSTNDPDDGGYIFRDSHDSQPFDLEIGTFVLQARTLDGGPNFDYIAFTLDAEEGTASVNDIQDKASNFSAYPNPSTGGVFSLNMESKWEVYNVLGVKMLKGEGKTVNLSELAKGVYMLKTPFVTKTLISK